MHFIDFETSTVALPFTEGMRPYEAVAFQYSHHLVYEGEGHIEHRGQLILDAPGFFPNFEFVHQLKIALDKKKEIGLYPPANRSQKLSRIQFFGYASGFQADI